MIKPVAIHRLLRADSGTTPREKTPTAHLIGVCGAGMRALAELLTGMGYRVTGSDLQPAGGSLELLKSRGLRVHQGHHRDFVPTEVDMVVYSPAVQRDNPERRLAAELKIPQFSYSEMLGRLMSDKVGVSIAGTHGKSTTTAMVAAILDCADRNPSVVLGAEVLSRGASGWAGDGDLFVAESCEFQQSFLDLYPTHAAILGIEPDHFDCYPDVDSAVATYADFAAKLPVGGSLVVRGDCRAAMRACSGIDANVETFSLERGADWWAADPRPSWSGTRFRVFHQGDFFAEMLLQIPGDHNVLNALAAAALCSHLGVEKEQICDGLAEFRGIGRRFQDVGSWRGVTLIDDYAHHPTAVAATLAAARQRFGDRRIWCAFQPHQISRTVGLMSEFSRCFSTADRVLITPVYAAREADGDQPSAVAEELADRIAAQHSHVRFCRSLDQTVTTIEDEAQPGDILITMGAGDINRVHNGFTRRLQRHYTPQRAAGSLHLYETGWTRPIFDWAADEGGAAAGDSLLSRERIAAPHFERRLQHAH